MECLAAAASSQQPEGTREGTDNHDPEYSLYLMLTGAAMAPEFKDSVRGQKTAELGGNAHNRECVRLLISVAS